MLDHFHITCRDNIWNRHAWIRGKSSISSVRSRFIPHLPAQWGCRGKAGRNSTAREYVCGAASRSAEKPKHPKALNLLFQMYACSCLVERSWRFGLPLVLASVKGGFQTVAVVGFISPVAVAVFGPLVGQVLDSHSRRNGLRFAASGQVVFIAFAVILLMQVVKAEPGFVIQSSALFPVLLALSMAERLSGFAADVAVERDFIPQLAGKDNPAALAASNARLRQTDLVSELLGTLAFGWGSSRLGMARSLTALTAFTCLALPIELFLLRHIVAAAPEVMVAKKSKSRPTRILGLRGGAARARTRPLMLLPLAGIGQQVRNTLSGWSLYLRQPILPASLAYILLGFNAVLSPGGLMTAFLASRGLTGSAAALFRSGCALMGLSGTFVGKWLIAGAGLLRTGIIASTFQAAVLGCAAFIYHMHLSSRSSALAGAAAGASSEGLLISGVPAFTWAFCLLIVLSRIGIWTFDMVICQVFQMAVDPAEAATVSSAELALCNISELFMLGIAAVLSDPSFFGLLIIISVTAVAGAAAVFTAWALGERVGRVAGGSLMPPGHGAAAA